MNGGNALRWLALSAVTIMAHLPTSLAMRTLVHASAAQRKAVMENVQQRRQQQEQEHHEDPHQQYQHRTLRDHGRPANSSGIAPSSLVQAAANGTSATAPISLAISSSNSSSSNSSNSSNKTSTTVAASKASGLSNTTASQQAAADRKAASSSKLAASPLSLATASSPPSSSKNSDSLGGHGSLSQIVSANASQTEAMNRTNSSGDPVRKSKSAGDAPSSASLLEEKQMGQSAAKRTRAGGVNETIENVFESSVERTVEDAMLILLGPEAAQGRQCFVNEHNINLGCHVKCRCALWQQCFPHNVMMKDTAEHAEKGLLQFDVGACHISMFLMGVVSVFLIFFLISLVVLGRMALQWHEERAFQKESMAVIARGAHSDQHTGATGSSSSTTRPPQSSNYYYNNNASPAASSSASTSTPSGLGMLRFGGGER